MSMIKFIGLFFIAIFLMNIYFSIPMYDEFFAMAIVSFIGLFIGFMIFYAGTR